MEHQEEEDEEPWIEDGDSEKSDDNEQAFGSDLFSIDDTNPKDIYELTFYSSNVTGNDHVDADTFADRQRRIIRTITVQLTGIKARYPMLLQSTGMTLWNTSEWLCQYLVDYPNRVRGKSVIELGAGLGLCGIAASQLGASFTVLTDGDTDTLRNLRRNVAANNSTNAIESGEDGNDSKPSRNTKSETKDDNNSNSKKKTILCKQLLWGKHVDAFVDKWAPPLPPSSLHGEARCNERRGGFDVVMGSDIFYAQESVEILFDTVVTLLRDNGNNAIFIMSYTFRQGVTIDEVLSCANRHGLDWSKAEEVAPVTKRTTPPPTNRDGVYIFSQATMVIK